MTQEEKARAYDEAVNKLRRFMEQGVDPLITRADVQDFFPELAESDDEKIRKEIVRFIRMEVEDEIVGNKWLAWLGKQCTPAKLSEEEQNRFTKGVLTSCALSFINYLDAHKYEGKMCVSNGECEDIENAFHNAMWDKLHRYYCKYIEKQGEQKPVDKVEPKFKVGEKIRRKTPSSFDKDMQVARIEKDYYVCNHIGKFSSEVVPFSKQSSYELIEQKPAWSEEDEHRIKDTVYFLDTAKKHYASTEELDACIDWIQSLKDRVQLKQEWNEEDEIDKEILNAAILFAMNSTDEFACNGVSKEDVIDWLKSLRPQSRWKPSSEQIGLLQAIINEPNNAASESCQIVLREVLEQLKKLKEE